MGNHEEPRAGSRFSEDLIDGLNMLALLLPGTAVTYYGEEMGMVDNRNISCDVSTDPLGCLDNVTLGNFRDPQRTPFQWDTTTSAGHTLLFTASPCHTKALPSLICERLHDVVHVIASHSENPK